MKTSGLCSSTAAKASFPVTRTLHDRDIAFNFQQRSQRAQNHALIFGDYHTNRLARVLGNRNQCLLTFFL